MAVDRTFSNALVAMALPLIIGGALCCVRPESSGLWAVAMFFVPTLWLTIVEARKALDARRARAATRPSADSSRAAALARAIVAASLFLAVMLAARLAVALDLAGPAAADTADRAAAVLAGCYFMFTGNRLPKTLTPWSDQRDPGMLQRLRRRVGWTYLLAGLAFACVWAILRTSLAQPIGIAIVGGGIVMPALVARAVARIGREPTRSPL